MATSRDQRKEDTRRRVYEAALTVFRRDGVSACRIDDITSAAGVSRGTFYFHYPTKDDVLLEHLHGTEAQILSALDELPAEAPLPAVLERLTDALTTIWEPDPRLLPDVAAVALRTTATTAAMADAETGILRGAMAERFCAAAARGELGTALPPQILSDLYLGHMLSGLLAWVGNPSLALGVVLRGVTLFFWKGAEPRV